MKNKLEKILVEHGIYLDYEELESITYDIIKEYKEGYNVGLFPERVEFNPREKAFANEWQKENEILCYVNQGRGTLQNLMYDKNNKPIFYITDNDRVIVATVIQWLGTNIGFDFLERALKGCGYKIVKI